MIDDNVINAVHTFSVARRGREDMIYGPDDRVDIRFRDFAVCDHGEGSAGAGNIYRDHVLSYATPKCFLNNQE